MRIYLLIFIFIVIPLEHLKADPLKGCPFKESEDSNIETIISKLKEIEGKCKSLKKDASSLRQALETHLDKLAPSQSRTGATISSPYYQDNDFDSLYPQSSGSSYSLSFGGFGSGRSSSNNCDADARPTIEEEYRLIKELYKQDAIPPVSSNVGEYANCFKGKRTNFDYDPIITTDNSSTDKEETKKCIEKVRISATETWKSKCKSKFETSKVSGKNNALKEAVRSISLYTNAIISGSSQCSSEDIAEDILSFSIPLIATIGSLSVGTGLAGAGIALGGEILSSLVESLTKDGSAKAIDELAKLKDTQDLHCLYYYTQNKVLRCGEKNAISKSPVPKGIKNIMKQLINYGQENTDYKDGADIMIAKKADNYMQHLEENKITTPFSKNGKESSMTRSPITILHTLKKSLEQQQNISGSDQVISNKISELIKTYKDYKYRDKTADVTAKSQAFIQSFLSIDLGHESTNNSIYPLARVYNRLIELENPNDFHDDSVIQQLSSISQNSTPITVDLRAPHIVHDALIDKVPKKFKAQLKDLFSEYEANLQPLVKGIIKKKEEEKSQIEINNRKRNIGYITNLYKACTLTASAHYFKEKKGHAHSVNLIHDKPPKEYQKKCNMFRCRGTDIKNDGYLKFFPNKKKLPNNRPSELAEYQCGINLTFSYNLNRLKHYYMKYGNICPKVKLKAQQLKLKRKLGDDAK